MVPFGICFDSTETAVIQTFFRPLNKKKSAGFPPSLTPKPNPSNTDLSPCENTVFYHILSSTRIYTSNSNDERKTDMDRIRVMLADDNLNILRALTDYLSRKPDIELFSKFIMF